MARTFRVVSTVGYGITPPIVPTVCWRQMPLTLPCLMLQFHTQLWYASIPHRRSFPHNMVTFLTYQQRLSLFVTRSRAALN